MLSKDIPEGVLDEVHTWGYADDEEAVTNILIFTDGSGTMTNTWLHQPRDAGWAVVILGRLSSGRLRRIGESYGDVPLSNVRADYIWCPRPKAAMGLFWALASSCSVIKRLHIEMFTDSETRLVSLSAGREPSTGLVHQASPLRGRWQRSRRCSGKHTQLQWKGSPRSVFHDLAKGSKPPRRTIQLDALLFVARLLRSRYERLALTSWECRKADRGKTTLLSVRATPRGFQPQRRATLAGRSYARAVVSVRDPSRLVVTCRVGGHVLDSCVLHAPSAHNPPRTEEWWDSTGSILHTVFKPTRDRVVMIDANGRLGEVPQLCWRAPPDRTSTTTATVRITVFSSAIVIDVIVHCHTAGALLSQTAENNCHHHRVVGF